MSSSRAKIAELLRAIKMSLTPGDVHVPTTDWKRSRQARLARELRKLTEDPGLYVCRALTPESETDLRTWFEREIDPNLHATVVHSRHLIPWTASQDLIVVPKSQFLGFEVLGADRAIVLRFRCPELQTRWGAARREGATWDHPAYNPHLTVLYDPEHEVDDPSGWSTPPFDLVFGPELHGPLNEDVFKAGGDKPGQVHDPKSGKYVPKPKGLAYPGGGGGGVVAAPKPTGGGGGGGAPAPTAPVMFTGKEGNIGKFQQGLVDKLKAAHASGGGGSAIAGVVLPTSASKAVKDYQKALLTHAGAANTPVTYIVTPPKPKKPKAQGGSGQQSNPNASPHQGTQQLAQAVSGQAASHPKPPLPTPPAVDTKYPLHEQQLFSQKVAALQAAYKSPNPADALNAISAYSPALSAYKQKLLDTHDKWEQSKPVTPAAVGQTVSYLKVVMDSQAQTWHALPQRQHAEMSGPANDFRSKLPHTEKYVIDSYQGSGYGHMNSELRKNPGANTAEHDALDRALGKASMPVDVRVIRNFNSKELPGKANSLVGKVVEDPAYMSSSLHGTFGQGRNVSLHLNIPKGSKALYLNGSSNSTHAYEYEVLLARRTRYRVDKVEHDAGITRIYGTVLPVTQQPSVKKY